jgi:hypothetical protein
MAIAIRGYVPHVWRGPAGAAGRPGEAARPARRAGAARRTAERVALDGVKKVLTGILVDGGPGLAGLTLVLTGCVP